MTCIYILCTMQQALCSARILPSLGCHTHTWAKTIRNTHFLTCSIYSCRCTCCLTRCFTHTWPNHYMISDMLQLFVNVQVAFSSFTSIGPIMALAIAVHNIPEVRHPRSSAAAMHTGVDLHSSLVCSVTVIRLHTFCSCCNACWE